MIYHQHCGLKPVLACAKTATGTCQGAATAMAKPLIDLSGLQTENRNPRTVNIDSVPVLELCKILHQEDCTVPAAVEPCLPVIADAIEALSDRVCRGGRVFYIGAGTSGRLGVLDASEIPPTYSAPSSQFVALIAGGDYALRNAKEGAEDDAAAAQHDLEAFQVDPAVDSLIGIASSGRTPYVLGGLAWAKSIGCTTVGVVCAHPSAIGTEGNADFLISAVTGPESVTGSTRMKAGTATKLVLNMISTGIMIRTGKTYGNLMVDLKATNLKLKQRARNILRFIGGVACTQTDDELDTILAQCNGSTKLAAVTIVLSISPSEAEVALARNGGVLANVFQEARSKNSSANSQQEFVLCIDAGGTSCNAVMLSADGHVGQGVSGPCNVSSIGVDAAVSSIKIAIQNAVDDCDLTKGLAFQNVKFSNAWIALAGYDRPSLTPLVNTAIQQLLQLSNGKKPIISSDIDLLPSKLTLNTDLEYVIVLVAGTGSIAMLYQRDGSQFQRIARVGGWGHLLGDDGSGYAIGREGLRKALRETDMHRLSKTSDNKTSFSPLTTAIVEHFRKQFPHSSHQDLLSTIVAPDPAELRSGDATTEKTKRIASIAKVILSLAETNTGANALIETGAQNLSELVTLLAKTEGVATNNTGLVLAGGMMQDSRYRSRVLELIKVANGSFCNIQVVDQPALDGAEALLETQKT